MRWVGGAQLGWGLVCVPRAEAGRLARSCQSDWAGGDAQSQAGEDLLSNFHAGFNGISNVTAYNSWVRL